MFCGVTLPRLIPASRGAFPTICTRLSMCRVALNANKFIPNKRSCCWSPQVRPRRRLVLVLRSARLLASARMLADRARREPRLRL